MRLLNLPLLALLLIYGASQAGEPNADGKYSLKDEGPTSSKIRQYDIVQGSRLPFDKPYADLTEDQKSIVRSQYEPMLDGDEPPYPIRGLGPVYKAIGAAQQKLLVEGRITLVIDVDSQGNATSVTAYGDPDPRMTKFLTRLVLLEKYKPAICQGTPCAMQFPFKINFNVR
jgi:hypothetical protein